MTSEEYYKWTYLRETRVKFERGQYLFLNEYKYKDRNLSLYSTDLLGIAASCGNINAMQILINRKADTQQAIVSASTPEAVRLLYKYGATAAKNLINTSSVELAKALVECGANPNYIMYPVYNYNGIMTLEKRVPLIECIEHEKVVEYLLSLDISLFTKDKNDNSTIEVALVDGSSAVVGMIIEKLMEKPDYNLIHMYFLYMVKNAQSRHGTKYSLLEKVKHFIKVGIDVNCQNEKGISPLMILTKRKAVGDVIQLLMKYGADINQKDSDGRSILTRALLQKNLELCDYILQLGAKETKKHKARYKQLKEEYTTQRKNKEEMERPLMSDKERRTSGIDSIVRLANIHTEK